MNRCTICPGRHTPIYGDGPRTAEILCIGERPGQTEMKYGRVFIGDSGKEQDGLYFKLAGIERSEVRIINTVLCGDDRNKKPTAKEIEGCGSWHIPQELDSIQPFLVILMGATACSLTEIDLEIQHGIPFWGRIYNWEGWICGMYHPAAGMHRTDLMIPLMDDWKRLGRWLKETKPWGEEDVQTDYRRAEKLGDVRAYLSGHVTSLLGVDTETHDGEPYSIQISASPNTGMMLVLGHVHLEYDLAQWLEFYELVLHNAPADLPIVDKLAKLACIKTPKYRDTMQEAYHFQNLPQGLKPLTYRLLHKRRRSWDEVVGPWSKEKLREWLVDALIRAESEAVVIPQTGKRGQEIKPKIVKSEFEKKLRGIMTHLSKSEKYDPWKRVTPEMDEKFGRAPRKGVKWVPPDELLDYGCSDASDALELALLFDQMRAGIVNNEWKIAEDDWDDISSKRTTCAS